MSRLEELIKNLCPDGVKYKKIKEVASVERGKRVVRNQLPEGGKFLVYQNSLSPLGFIDDYNYHSNITFVIGAGAAGDVGFSKENFWAADDCFPIVCGDSLKDKYIYHLLLSKQSLLYSKVRRGSIPRLSRQVIEDMVIPVPPLEVQDEIVRILDNFTELTAELKDELSKRKEQFEAISTHLFDEVKQSGDVYILSDVCKIEKGKTPIQKANPGQYPLVVTTTERKSNSTFQFDSEAVCIPLVSSRGHGVASLNHVYYQDGKFALGNILCAVIPKDNSFVSAKYLYYYFEETKDYTLVPLMKGGANVALHISDIEKIKVPIPSKEKQELIIDYLTSFDNYCNIELPAEIEARQKQYEYYRDKLLSL